jgi:hypothetical protein
MAKKTRRRVVERPGPRPLIVVAGLPQAVYRRATEGFQARFPDTIVTGVPAKTADGSLYSVAYLEILLRAVGEFTTRRRSNGPVQPSPASVSLYYVPSNDQEKLLAAFDFFVMPVPLEPLAGWSNRGRQLRHNIELCEQVMIAAHQPTSKGRMALNEVTRRLGYESDNESLLLPPKNFQTEEDSLVSVFRQFRNGQRIWSDRMKELGPTDLNHDDVPKRIDPRQTRHPYVDSRGMAYFIAHQTAYDGNVWETSEDASVQELTMAMKSLYRFGSSIPQGLHHDVQRSDGGNLAGAHFRCATKGLISSTEDYANIYPNDFVRVTSYQSEQE